MDKLRDGAGTAGQLPGRLESARLALLAGLQSLRHAVPGQSRDVGRLGQSEELGHVRRTDAATAEPAFEALQTEGCQHQQTRDEHDEER
ncbi:MAG: hypothetical protein QOH57_2770 [Mycobacterium sp.]|nr:hypothetical protein [Mycobacterium sp.]